jgi:predicted permease
MPHLQQVTVTGRVLAFNAAVCLLVACLFSLVPVLVASKLDFETALRSGRAAGAAKGSTRLFSFLIAGEAALAFLLLVGAGLMVRSLIRLEEADMGIHPDHVLTLKVPIGTALHRPKQFDTRPQQMAYFQQLVERLQTVRGVSAAAVVNNLPLSPANTTLSEPLRSASAQTTGNLRARCVSPRYFAVMGIPLLAGRDFSPADNSTAPAVVILNEHLARHLFPDGNAVGRSVSGGGKSSTVIGVVKDAPQMSYEAPAQDEVYFSYQQLIFGSFLAAVVVRTAGDPLALAGILQKEVWAVNRDQPIVKVETMSDVIADSIWRPRFSSWVLAAIGGLALLLMSAGVYGVIAYTANLRAHEVGIRVALGARPREVVGVILRDTMVPVAAGLAASTAAALLLHRLLASLLYGVSGADPLTYASSAAVLAGVGALASAGPAWKAATADPVKALRSE